MVDVFRMRTNNTGSVVFVDVLKNIFLGELFYPILAIAAAALAVGGATAWAACSRRHWFTRTAVVGAALSASLLIPGYDLVLILFTQAVVTILLLQYIKFWRLWRATRSKKQDDDKGRAEPTGWPPRFRFTLADLLLVTLVLAVVMAVGAQVPKDVWAEWMWIGALGFGVATPVLCLPGSLMILTGKRRLGSMPAAKQRKIGRAGRVILLVPLTLGPCWPFFIAFPAIAIFHVAIHPTPLPEITLPDPNGYDDLVRAGAQLANVNVPDVEKATLSQLTRFLAAQAPSLALARQGLDRECLVPLTYTPADTAFSTVFEIRNVWRAFLAEGKLAELEDRPSEAVTSYLDILRLGEAVSRGGTFGDTSVGWAAARLAADSLASMSDRLDTAQCGRVIEALEAFDANREPLEDLVDREVLWREHALGKAGRVKRVMIPDFLGSEPLSQVSKRNQAVLRLLTCELALRQHRLEHGADPQRLDELAPKYLSAVPQDPHGDGPLIYRRTESTYELYSVGPDGVDDGGKPLEESSAAAIRHGDVHLVKPAEEEPAP